MRCGYARRERLGRCIKQASFSLRTEHSFARRLTNPLDAAIRTRRSRLYLQGACQCCFAEIVCFAFQSHPNVGLEVEVRQESCPVVPDVRIRRVAQLFTCQLDFQPRAAAIAKRYNKGETKGEICRTRRGARGGWAFCNCTRSVHLKSSQ